MKTTQKSTEKDGRVILPDGTEYQFTKATRDTNGNSRYYVSWMALGLPRYEATAVTRRAGLKKIKTKAFGGGFIFQCAHGNLIRSAEFFHSLGLHRPIVSPTAILIDAQQDVDNAMGKAVSNEVRAGYILQSLAHALRAGKKQDSRTHRQIKQLEALADTL